MGAYIALLSTLVALAVFQALVIAALAFALIFSGRSVDWSGWLPRKLRGTQ